LKLIEGDDVKYQTFLGLLDKVEMDEVAHLRGVGKQAAASNDVDESTHCSEGLDFTETGAYSRNNIRRKKGAC
jgi:hypothetical protein